MNLAQSGNHQQCNQFPPQQELSELEMLKEKLRRTNMELNNINYEIGEQNFHSSKNQNYNNYGVNNENAHQYDMTNYNEEVHNHINQSEIFILFI